MKKTISLAFMVLYLTSVFAQQEIPLYIGTYTGNGSHGIYVAKFNTNTGSVIFIDSIAVENPSFIAVNKKGNRLYSVTENGGTNPGAASAFMQDEESGKWVSLNLNAEPTRGDHPCYIAINSHGTHAVVANYNGGSLSVFPIDLLGALNPVSQLVPHSGKSVNADRQQSSHVHSTMFSPDEKWLVAADLGTDFITAYPFKKENEDAPLDTLRAIKLKLQAGAGPRHISFHPTLPILYVMEEMSGKVAVVKFMPAQKQMQVLQTIQSDRVSKQPGSADIHISKDGRFLYTSNRIEANDIAVFAVDKVTGKLTFKQALSSGGIKPRNFTLSPDGKFLLAANQQTSNIVVFNRNTVTGLLSPTGIDVKLPSPVCLVFQQ